MTLLHQSAVMRGLGNLLVAVGLLCWSTVRLLWLYACLVVARICSLRM